MSAHFSVALDTLQKYIYFFTALEKKKIVQ